MVTFVKSERSLLFFFLWSSEAVAVLELCTLVLCTPGVLYTELGVLRSSVSLCSSWTKCEQ